MERLEVGNLAIISIRSKLKLSETKYKLVQTEYVVISDKIDDLLIYSEVSFQDVELKENRAIMRKSYSPFSLVSFNLN